jgi:hypothetical protein
MVDRTDDLYLKRLIADYFGSGSRLRVLRPAPAFGASGRATTARSARSARHSAPPTPTSRRSPSNRAWTCSTRRNSCFITSG